MNLSEYLIESIGSKKTGKYHILSPTDSTEFEYGNLIDALELEGAIRCMKRTREYGNRSWEELIDAVSTECGRKMGYAIGKNNIYPTIVLVEPGSGDGSSAYILGFSDRNGTLEFAYRFTQFRDAVDGRRRWKDDGSQPMGKEPRKMADEINELFESISSKKPGKYVSGVMKMGQKLEDVVHLLREELGKESDIWRGITTMEDYANVSNRPIWKISLVDYKKIYMFFPGRVDYILYFLPGYDTLTRVSKMVNGKSVHPHRDGEEFLAEIIDKIMR